MAWWWSKKKKEEQESSTDTEVLEAIVKAAFTEGAEEVEKKELPPPPKEEKELEPESILSKYSIVPEKYETKILGESIGVDFLEAATNFASSYFKWKEDISDLEALEKSLEEKYNRLCRLNLENCQNAKELSKIKSETYGKIRDNRYYGNRKDLVVALYDKVKSFTPILISYKDFISIAMKYKYRIGLVRDYEGFLTEQNITGLEEINSFDRAIRIDRTSNGIINIVRSYCRDLYKLPDISESVDAGRWPFALLVEKKECRWYKNVHPKFLCIIEVDSGYRDSSSRYEIPGQEVREGDSDKLEGEISDLKQFSLEDVCKEYKIETEGKETKALREELLSKVNIYYLAYDTILALYPTEKDSKSPAIIFQFYTDGVIVYGSLGEEDIFTGLDDNLFDLSKKFYYQ